MGQCALPNEHMPLTDDWSNVLDSFIRLLLAYLVFLPSYTAKTILKELTIHGGPFILMLIELPFNTYQFPPRHIVILATIGIAYLVINFGNSCITQYTRSKCSQFMM